MPIYIKNLIDVYGFETLSNYKNLQTDLKLKTALFTKAKTLTLFE